MFEKIQFRRLAPTDLRAERKTERGATATEYSLLVAFIAFIIVAGVAAFAADLGALFTDMGGIVELWPN